MSHHNHQLHNSKHFTFTIKYIINHNNIIHFHHNISQQFPFPCKNPHRFLQSITNHITHTTKFIYSHNSITICIHTLTQFNHRFITHTTYHKSQSHIINMIFFLFTHKVLRSNTIKSFQTSQN